MTLKEQITKILHETPIDEQAQKIMELIEIYQKIILEMVAEQLSEQLTK